MTRFSHVPFDEALEDATGGNAKVLTSDLSSSGKYAVIDQGQQFISGYVDDENLLYRRNGEPVILFGDHTKIIKFIDFDFVLGADGVKALKARPGFYPRYLLHYLHCIPLPNNLGYSRHFKYLKAATIPKPPINEQKRIATMLDKSDAIRKKRSDALKLADEFLRSVFLDMFGDPVANPKRWNTAKLGTITKKIGSGATPLGGDAVYKTSGISFIRSLNVHDRKFLMKDLAYLDISQSERLANVEVMSGDVLLNITGASVARCCLVPGNVLPARVNQHVSIIRPSECIVSEFLEAHLVCETVKCILLGIGESMGATRQAITKAQLEAFSVIVPPIGEQERFAKVVAKVRQQKQVMQEFAIQSELLFQSIQQQAFA